MLRRSLLVTLLLASVLGACTAGVRRSIAPGSAPTVGPSVTALLPTPSAPGSPSAAPASPSGAPASPSAPASPAATTPAAQSPAPSGSAPTGQMIRVAALDYQFQGIPERVKAGDSFMLLNRGKELHELVLVRRNEGVTKSFQELLALPEEQAMTKVTILGQALAAPNEQSEQMVATGEPGAYLAICFIPVGTKAPAEGAEPSPGNGPPHFTRGMLQEFNVAP